MIWTKKSTFCSFKTESKAKKLFARNLGIHFWRASVKVSILYIVDKKKSRIIVLLTLNSPSERFSPHFMIQRWCRERGHCIWQSFLHCMSPLKNIWANLLNLYVLDAKNTSLFLLYNILNLIEKHMWAPWLPLTISPKGSNGSKGPNSQKGKKKETSLVKCYLLWG